MIYNGELFPQLRLYLGARIDVNPRRAAVGYLEHEPNLSCSVIRYYEGGFHSASS